MVYRVYQMIKNDIPQLEDINFICSGDVIFVL